MTRMERLDTKVKSLDRTLDTKIKSLDCKMIHFIFPVKKGEARY